MKKEYIDRILEKQTAFFASGKTLDVNYRIEALKKLRDALQKNEAAIADALRADLGKSREETYMCETGIVLAEISYMLRHIRRFARETTVATPLAQFASRSFQKPTPYGVTLIMSPWNYPLMLTLDPLVDARAAGNTAATDKVIFPTRSASTSSRTTPTCSPPARPPSPARRRTAPAIIPIAGSTIRTTRSTWAPPST